MSNVNVFEVASRKKYRFTFNGKLTVEDLWDLTLSQLNDMFKNYNGELKKYSSEEESLIDNSDSKEAEEIKTKIEIIKHIFNIKNEEKKAAERAAESREKAQKIMAAIARKQDEALENSSIEELQQMLNDLANK